MPLIRAEFLRPHQLGRTVLIHDISQVLYLPFDYDDGSYARDRSGRVNHGTIYGASRAAGKIGGALSFDGVDDYVEVPYSASLNLTGAMTVVGWVYPRMDQTYTRRTVSGREQTWHLTHRLDGADWNVYTSEGGWQSVVVNTGAPRETWSHLVGVYDPALPSNQLKLYINGQWVAEGNVVGSIPPTVRNVYFGAWEKVDNFLNGILDEVRIYNRTLSQAEIVRVMNLRGI